MDINYGGITLVIPFTPVAKGRPRMTKSGHAYTPEKTRNAEAELVSFIKASYKGQPYAKDVPLIANLWFSLPAPKKGKAKPTGRPDLDNFVKLVFDSCNGILWHDDSQIVGLVAMKAYAGTPCIVLQVSDTKDDLILRPKETL